MTRPKLYAPRLRHDRVPRPELLARLDEGLESHLTLLAAPAGYGKTTLLCQWLEQQTLPEVWLTLDEGDNDLVTFLGHVIASVCARYPGACAETRAVLRSRSAPPLALLLETLTNDLDELDEIILVLDDAGFLQDLPILELLNGLVRVPARSLHLVLATRRDPFLPLGTLRGRGLLTEIRAHDLRFSEPEAAALLESATGLRFSTEQVAALVERTEGWAAGLQMAALSLRASDDPSRLIPDFTGSDRYVADYLFEEILSRQTPDVQQYLLRTSILERLCAPLCRELVGQGISQEVERRPILEWLEEENLFLIALDGERVWFRFHNLFRDLLRHALQLRSTPEEIAGLHSRAGAWLAREGFVDRALAHLLTAGDVAEACALVEARRNEAVDEERWLDLERWLARLPADARSSKPGLLLAEAWLAHARFNLPGLADLVSRAEHLLGQRKRGVDGRRFNGEIGAFRAEVAYWQGDAEGAVHHARLALEDIADSCLQTRMLGHLMAAGGLQLQGDILGAITLLRRAWAEESDNGLHAAVMLGLVSLELMDADLPAAEGSATSMLHWARERALDDTASWARMFLGKVAYQRNDLRRAEGHFSAVAERPHGSHVMAVKESLYGLTLTSFALGFPDRAQQTVDALSAWARNLENPLLIAEAQAFQTHLEIIQGISLEAEASLSQFDRSGGPSSLHTVWEFPELTLAQTLILDGGDEHLARADVLLGQLRSLAEANANTFRLIQVLALKAMALDRRGREDESCDILGQAVAHARPGGLIRIFTDLGPSLLPLLERLAGGKRDLFLRQILAAFGPQGQIEGPDLGSASMAAPRSGNSSPLTNRELEVLFLLDQRLSNKEIARQLFISPGTVKRHTLNIYSKLGVAGRREACSVAHSQGLLRRL